MMKNSHRLKKDDLLIGEEYQMQRKMMTLNICIQLLMLSQFKVFR